MNTITGWQLEIRKGETIYNRHYIPLFGSSILYIIHPCQRWHYLSLFDYGTGQESVDWLFTFHKMNIATILCINPISIISSKLWICIFVAAGWLAVHHAGPHPREIRVGRVSVQKVHVSIELCRTLENFVLWKVNLNRTLFIDTYLNSVSDMSHSHFDRLEILILFPDPIMPPKNEKTW